jgi:hypothetical protein
MLPISRILQEILSNPVVIMPAQKKLYYKKLLLNSNKPKTIWNIVKTITNNKNTTNNISTMNINDQLSSNPLSIAITPIFHQ